MAVLVDQARNTFLSGGGRHTLEIDIPPDLPGDGGRAAHRPSAEQPDRERRPPLARDDPIRIDAARDGFHVAISVADQGRGVPPEVLPRLFRKYAGAGGDGGPARGGYGLGLAICKGLVERTEAASARPAGERARGRGSRSFTLPAAAEADGNESVRPAASGPDVAED